MQYVPFNRVSLGLVMTFGIWLKSERDRRGWTQRVLADRAGISSAMVARIEKDSVGYSMDMVTRIAEALSEGADPASTSLVIRDAKLAAAGVEMPEMERIISDDDEWEVVKAYRGVETRMQKSIKELLISAVEVTGDEPKEELVYGRGPIKGHKPLE